MDATSGGIYMLYTGRRKIFGERVMKEVGVIVRWIYT